MNRILATLVLPPTISAFERSYLLRMNRVALWFFAAHIPFLAIVAWLNGTGRSPRRSRRGRAWRGR